MRLRSLALSSPVARRLADLGKTVALIERKELGGTCINTGCTPTKTMIASAQVAHYARHATRWGVRTTGVTVDLPAIVARKDRIVQRFRRAPALGGRPRELAPLPGRGAVPYSSRDQGRRAGAFIMIVYHHNHCFPVNVL